MNSKSMMQLHQTHASPIKDYSLDAKTLKILHWVFVVGGLGIILLGFFDNSGNLLTEWDQWCIPITAAAYLASGLLMYFVPQRLTSAILLSFLPTAIYQHGILFWAVHFPSPESYYSVASSGPFFPVVYLVLFIALPKYAAWLSWIHCGLFFVQAGFNTVYFLDSQFNEGRQAAEHLLISILCSQPVYIVSLRYIVALREYLHQTQQEIFFGKTRFLGMLSHEINNLLQGMISALDVLELKIKNPDEKKSLTRLMSSTGQLQTYLRDVAELTKLENPSLHINVSSFRLAEFLGEIHDAWANRAESKKLSLSLGMHPRLADTQIETDPERLRQVFDNLISNAIKYTPSGEIRIYADFAPDDKSKILFDVSDTGVGIDSIYYKAIFEPHVRLNQPGTQRSEGSGLGLTVVARILAALGGSITVFSAVGQGTTFRVLLKSLYGNHDSN